MPDKVGDDPRYEIKIPEIEAILKDLGGMLGKLMPEGYGFALQIFAFRGEAFFYISNADREDMIKALREFINREQ